MPAHRQAHRPIATSPAERALVIYARPPVAGQVKTRLQPAFSPDEAFQLYEAMLCDIIDLSERACAGLATLFVSFSAEPAQSGETAERVRRTRVERQRGADLGERMVGTLQEKLHGGFRQVVLIGSDSPNLPTDYIRRAFDALDEADMVIGPSDDGGYYLLGARRLHPQLFQRIAWGTPQVIGVTRDRIKAAAIACRELPLWYDVDTPASVTRLWRDLQHMKARGSSDLPLRSHRALAALAARGKL